jgi:metal-responsive CopG/Arc/MetJ family transcriptional regulator
MARKTKIVKLSLPQDIYVQLEELADQMGISKSEFLRKALKQYVASEMRWQRIRKWGEETAKRMNIKDEDDVDRIIHEFRRERARC